MHREEVFIAAAHSTAALCTTKGLQGTRLSYQHVAQIPNSTQDLFLTQPRKQEKTLRTTSIHGKLQDGHEGVFLETSVENHGACTEVTPGSLPSCTKAYSDVQTLSMFLSSFIAAIVTADPKGTFSNF